MITTFKFTRCRVAFIGAMILLVAIPATAIGYRLTDADRSISGGASPTVIDIERTVNGVSLVLETAATTGNGIEVTFSLTLPEAVARSSQANVLEPMFPGDQLQFANITVQPSGLQMRSKPHLAGESIQTFSNGESVEMIAIFEQVRAAGADAQIVFGPYMARLATSAAVVIAEPLGNWRSGSILIDGEQFAVTDGEYRAEEGMLDVVVTNQEKLDLASVLFLATDEGSVTVIDGAARSYEVLHASTGLRRDDSGTVAAGDSTFTISGPFDPDLDQLTLTVAHSSKLVPSTVGADIQLP